MSVTNWLSGKYSMPWGAIFLILAGDIIISKMAAHLFRGDQLEEALVCLISSSSA